MKVATHLKNRLQILDQKVTQSRLKNHKFTIISNNCWGGEVYRALNLRYESPFVGLFMFAPCYINLVKEITKKIDTRLNFVNVSRYELANDYREQGVWELYPIGLLNDEIEIHFMHYENEIEAREKWLRRTQRIDWNNENNIFFKFCDSGLCTKELIEEFHTLEAKHKICFTSKNYPNFASNIWIEECQKDDSVMDGRKLYKFCHKYFDLLDWLNGGSGKINPVKKLVNNWLYNN
ncbi:DUF1919 domain-containing protein [Scytonema sp. NUACC21]